MTVDVESNENVDSGSYCLKVFGAGLNIITHLTIGIVVSACLQFAVSGGLPMNATAQHIVLCVIGYQVLMAEAVLALSPDNGWTKRLKFKDQRRAHGIMQVVGSALAIAGSVIKMMDKNSGGVNFDTLHGQFGLVAMVFTTVSLVNGVTSANAYEWRAFCPGNISKITHICFGIVAFAASSICLCYGIDKVFFRRFITEPYADTLIVFTAFFTVIIIITPAINFFKKSYRFIKK